MDRVLPDAVADLNAHMCGCGSPEEAWEWIRDYLRDPTYPKDANGEHLPTTGPWWVAVYLLDHLGLTEHGGSVGCSWITEKGEDVLAFLDQWGTDWQDTRVFWTRDGVLVSSMCEAYAADPEGMKAYDVYMDTDEGRR